MLGKCLENACNEVMLGNLFRVWYLFYLMMNLFYLMVILVNISLAIGFVVRI